MRTKQRRVKRLDGEPLEYECRRCRRTMKWFRFPLPQSKPAGGMYLQPCFQCGKTYREARKVAASGGPGL